MSKKQTLVSIITISLNSEDHIEKTIESVLSQDYPNIEYWIIDGGSTDRTVEIIRKYEDKLHYLSEPDKGISDAMNKGIELSKGEIIAHLHSNDTYLPGVISKVVKLFTEHPDRKWLYGDIRCFDEEGRSRRNVIFPKRYSYDYRLLKKMILISHPAVFVKKEVFNEVGLFNVQYKYAMDYDMWLRIGAKYDPLQVNKVFANFTETGLSSLEAINALKEEYRIRRSLDESLLFYMVNYFSFLRRRCLFPLIRFKRRIQFYYDKG
jgi:glycosyltransferase involved in cell wall biosynthesis